MKIRQFAFNMFSVNTYVVWDETTHEAAIIDPGMIDDYENAQLDSFIKSENLNVIHLINTHLHLDHTFGDDYIKKQYNLTLKGHISDNILGMNRAAQARMFGIPVDLQPITIDTPLDENDTITLGNENIKILHIPGHSPGSIVLYFPQSGFVLSGDVLFRSSIGRTDLTQGNHEQLIDGITTKLLTLPPETIVYPGHGPMTSIKFEITNNPYL